MSDLLRLAMIREGEEMESIAAPESTPAAAGSGVARCRGLSRLVPVKKTKMEMWASVGHARVAHSSHLFLSPAL
jgi:predicted phage gp36 major capsid-like protein